MSKIKTTITTSLPAVGSSLPLYLVRALLVAFFILAAPPLYSTETKSLAKAEVIKVSLKTDLGEMMVELWPQKSPKTVANFLNYVDKGFYDGTIFHRVIPNFMIQTGGFTFDFVKKPTDKPVENESANGLLNTVGTLSMARLPDPDSATAQFFINLQHNTHLNAAPNQPGYTVFGKVTMGMDVVEKIAKEPTGQYRAFPNAPNVPVRILKAVRVKAEQVQAP